MINRAILVCAVLFLAHCGGGGGSSSSRGVRVLHAALDAAPVALSGTEAPSTIAFATSQKYQEVTEEFQTVTLTELPNLQISQFPLRLDGDERKSLLFFEAGGEYRTALLDDVPPAELDEQAAVRIVNGVDGTDAIRAEIAGTPLVVALGGASSYLARPAGTVPIIARAADGTEISRTRLQLLAGRSYSLLLAGESGAFVTPVLLDDE